MLVRNCSDLFKFFCFTVLVIVRNKKKKNGICSTLTYYMYILYIVIGLVNWSLIIFQHCLMVHFLVCDLLRHIVCKVGLERVVYAYSVNGHFSEVWNMKNRKLICQNIIFCTIVICERIFLCTRMHEKPYIYKCEDNLLCNTKCFWTHLRISTCI